MDLKTLDYGLIDETLIEIMVKRRSWQKSWAHALDIMDFESASKWKDVLDKSKDLEKRAKFVLRNRGDL